MGFGFRVKNMVYYETPYQGDAMFDIIVALLAIIGFFTIVTAAFLVNLHIDNLATIAMNQKAAEREKLAAANRIN